MRDDIFRMGCGRIDNLGSDAMKLLVYESGREYDLEGPVIVDEDPVHGKVVHGGGIGVVVKNA